MPLLFSDNTVTCSTNFGITDSCSVPTFEGNSKRGSDVGWTQVKVAKVMMASDFATAC
jgi:hypothetical protein